jgi:hypothetical protein
MQRWVKNAMNLAMSVAPLRLRGSTERWCDAICVNLRDLRAILRWNAM